MRARIDVSEIEAKTKIRAKYLRALENEEWGLLPGPTFVKSFLRTYAQALDLDAKSLVEEYRLSQEHPSEAALEPIVSSPQRNRGRGAGRAPVGASRGYMAIVGDRRAADRAARRRADRQGRRQPLQATRPSRARPRPRQKRKRRRAQHAVGSQCRRLRRRDRRAVAAPDRRPSTCACSATTDARLIPGLELQPGASTPTYHARRFAADARQQLGDDVRRRPPAHACPRPARRSATRSPRRGAVGRCRASCRLHELHSERTRGNRGHGHGGADGPRRATATGRGWRIGCASSAWIWRTSSIVGDRPEDMQAALDFMAREGMDVVVTSGGLGPTADDLTAEVVGRFQGREMVLDEALSGRIAQIVAPLMKRWPNIDAEAIEVGNAQAGDDPARRDGARAGRHGARARGRARSRARRRPDGGRAAGSAAGAAADVGAGAAERGAARGDRGRDDLRAEDAAAVRDPRVGDRRDAACGRARGRRRCIGWRSRRA